MIVFFIFLVLGFFLTLYYIVRKIDPTQEEKVFDKVSLSMKIHNEFTKLLKSGELLIPKGLFISNGHIWYKALPDGKIRIGIDDFPLKLLGEIDKIKLNSRGDTINKRGGMCVIKQGRKKLKFFSPIGGTISKVNDEVVKNIGILKADPYERGWLYIVKPAIDITYLRQEMEPSVSTQEWIEKEIEKLSDFVVKEFPSRKKLDEMFQKKAVYLEGILKDLDSYAWQKFQENFLR